MRLTITIFTLLLYLDARTQTPDWAWARAVASSNIDEVTDIAGDASGNVYVTGYFTGAALVVGTTTLTNPSGGNMQFYVAKYDRTGTPLWAKSAGGNDDDTGTGIAVDGSGNVYVCGDYESSTINFGTTAHTNTSQPGQADIFLVKYSSAGSLLWSHSFGGGLQEEANDIAVDASGNVVLTGNYHSLSVLFGNFGVINSGASDGFVVKFSSGGVAQWAKRIGGGMIDNANAVGIDNSGNVYVAGEYNSNTVQSFTPALSNSGGFDIFIAKYSSAGSSLFATRLGGSGDEGATALYGTAAGDFFVAGYFESGSILVGSVTLNNSSTRNMFVARYNTSGVSQWAKRAPGNQNSYPRALHAAGTSLYMSGAFDLTTLAFGSVSITNGGSLDAFVVSYATSNGAEQWGRSSNSAGLDQSNAVGVAGGNVHIGGLFTSTLTLRDNVLTASGSADGFLVKMCLPPAAPLSATGATACSGVLMQLNANVPAGTNAAWFTTATGGAPVFTGSNFATSIAGVFYVAAKDTNAGCGMYSANRITVPAVQHPPVNATVSVAGHTLNASGNGSVVGWYNCVSNSTITGQTSSSYVLTGSGHFAVIMISPEGCRDTSACNHYSYTPGSDTTIVTVGVRSVAAAMPKISAYPNPSSGTFEVRSSQPVRCILVNALGVTVDHFSLDEKAMRSRQLGPFPPGLYFIVPENRSGIVRVVVSD